MPDSLFRTIENGAAVTDASGTTIPGLRRTTWVGPSGITTGQYGVFASVVTMVEDANGDRVIRRLEIVQESFARYAYFTDFDASTGIVFANGDRILGPVHSNDSIRIHSSGATFEQRVTTAGAIIGRNFGTYNGPVFENVNPIPMPTTTALSKLRNYAIAGGTRFISSTTGAAGQANLRLEFMPVDLNGDTRLDGSDEGFMRVYVATGSTGAAWISANVSSNSSQNNNCGDDHSGTFVRAASHPSGGHSADASLNRSSSRCYLGGVDELFNGFQASNGFGDYVAWPGTVDPRLNSRADKNYLWPVTRDLNPNFKGVIFVDGKVVISGQLRGRITLAATDNIVIGDDVRYVTSPAVGTCDDILGLFAGTNVVIADNALNTPWQPPSAGWRTFDESSAEQIDAVVLALNIFTAEDFASGPTSAEPCNGRSWGRGCLALTGGVIQRTRGAVGTTNGTTGTGYGKLYDYDQCAGTNPPPYFPTTGWYIANRYFDVDPTGFSIANLFASLTPPGI
jgi:hypothetical protein